MARAFASFVRPFTLFSLLLFLLSGCGSKSALRPVLQTEGKAPLAETIRRTDNLNQRINGRTPLQWASFYGYRSVVRELVKRGADTEVRSKHGGTALHSAAAGGAGDVAVFLVDELGLKTGVENEAGKTPLFIALERGRPGVARVLEDRKAELNITDNRGRTLAHAIAKSGLDAWLITVARSGVWVGQRDDRGRSPLYPAAKNGQLAVARKLIERYQLDPNQQDLSGVSPLHLAAEKGYSGMMDLLLKKGADPNVTDSNGRTPLHELARNGTPADFNRLVDREPIINPRDEKGRTPLYLALNGARSASRNLPVAELLLEHGAEFYEVRGGYGRSSVERMIAHYGESIAREASKYNHPRVLQLILERAAVERDPLLKLATEEGNVEAVERLLDHGADPAAEFKGKTILEIARQQGRSKVVSLINSLD